MITITPWQAGQEAAPPATVLAQLWLRSVLATHDFLDSAAIAELHPLVRDVYLPAVQVWLAHDEHGALLGFSGLGLPGADAPPPAYAKVEMLFIDPAAQGRGAGTALLDHARARHGGLDVDVNEQNPRALGFYLHYGFGQIGRSAVDAAGRPYPLLHLRRD
ncbi:GNAT family N-acetyltransferase [Bordetella genomosp. 5]|uniref:GNAT family N-acetyltransferase n=1 Tax=Bordetella genomosp. 5 TaxID=1395608 RepID=UPI000B9E2C91|nr:GNAT family N-acetyltransferase [Bordetella genomosp. 5]OZI44794.1 GNAT family N-acetyltransferase [Bordetella genomosp. 5]